MKKKQKQQKTNIKYKPQNINETNSNLENVVIKAIQDNKTDKNSFFSY